MIEKNALLRELPQVEELLETPCLQAAMESLPRQAVVDAARAAVDDARQAILAGNATCTPSADAIAQAAQLRTLALGRRSLRRVVNASGVIVHTNLGRSPLAASAVEAVNDVIAGYSTLEYDTASMARGSRHAHCEQLICALTGAESAIAVNNNAAAVMMVLSQFVSGGEAIVSRGEEVEIGGSFRIPDIMAQSHARMVEVGATNKTHEDDYRRAITGDTAMLLKVHRSNFRLVGFTEEVGVAQLAALAAEENARRTPGSPQLLVYEDQGSGAFIRLDCFGSYAEPTVRESLQAGVDLVSFSGDKLLGGPQAGIIAGRKELIDQLKKNPLARALRLDKMTLAALEATLRLYLDPQRALREVPTLRMLSTPATALLPRAQRLEAALKEALPAGVARVDCVEEVSRAGGGALPMCDIDTWAVALSFERGSVQDCHRYMVSERELPVVGRISHDTLLLDLRTLLSVQEEEEVLRAVAEYAYSL
ncbi:MAG: L-seryl-tRNA(Sec) selenium transferase [Coriobacteriales bacterium]